MPFPIESLDTFEFRIYTLYNGQLAVNQRGYEYVAGSGGLNTTSAIVNQTFLDANLAVIMTPLLVTGASILGTSIRLNPNPEHIATDYSTVITGTGSGGTVALPKQTSGLIRFRSNLAGKRGIGHTYVPFPPADSNLTTGVPSAAYTDALDGLGSLLLGPISILDVGTTLGQLRSTVRVTSATIGSPALMTRFFSLPAWATQRRRGDFGRVNRNPFSG